MMSLERSTSCCKTALRESPAASPFYRIVIVGWYDGETNGVAVCKQCDAEYAFDLVAWDEMRRLRIFTLADMPHGSLDEMVRIFASSGAPVWPAWWPTSFASDAERDDAWRKANNLLKKSGPVRYLVAAEDLSASLAFAGEVITRSQGSRLQQTVSSGQPFDD